MESLKRFQLDHVSCSAVSSEPNRLRSGFINFVATGNEDNHFDPSRHSYETCSRITSILKRVESDAELHAHLVYLSARSALDSELLLSHSKGYLAKLNRLVTNASDHFSCNESAQEEFESIYMNKSSLAEARLSAGSTMECLDSLFSTNNRMGACAVRPPGHHAESHCAMGFCFFNNVALAAKRALDLHQLKRVMIVDFDIHHGNATQRMFLHSAQVLYVSIHRWDKGRFYPLNGDESSASSVGDLEGKGWTVNVAFSHASMGDLEYRAVVESVLVPLVSAFNPELVLFSAGFDVVQGDPIGNYCVSPRALGCLVYKTMRAASNSCKSLLVLEGGYNTKQTAEGFCECLYALCHASRNEESDRFETWPVFTLWNEIKPQAVEAINATVQAQKAYWKDLKSL